jgi:hypothetical protein
VDTLGGLGGRNNSCLCTPHVAAGDVQLRAWA